MKTQRGKSLFKKENPKPLLSKGELSEIAKKALRAQVEQRIRELAVDQTSLEKIGAELQRLHEALDGYMTKLGSNTVLEREVLERLKEKLSTG